MAKIWHCPECGYDEFRIYREGNSVDFVCIVCNTSLDMPSFMSGEFDFYSKKEVQAKLNSVSTRELKLSKKHSIIITQDRWYFREGI